jgi:putative acetyltransferase
MSAQIEVRVFAARDAVQVRELFIKVNRLVAPPELKESFEGYIALSLKEEIDRIADYYSERDGGFWVAIDAGRVVGMFGLEPSFATAMELRRMYVDPDARRRGIARDAALCRGGVPATQSFQLGVEHIRAARRSPVPLSQCRVPNGT